MVQSSLLTFSEEITKYAAELINVERGSHRNPAVLAMRIYTSVPSYLNLQSTEQALNRSFQAQE